MSHLSSVTEFLGILHSSTDPSVVFALVFAITNNMTPRSLYWYLSVKRESSAKPVHLQPLTYSVNFVLKVIKLATQRF